MDARETAECGQIIRGLVGSNALGLNIPGTDDRDEMAVFIEPAERVAGISAPLDSYVFRTAGEGQRSRPGDIDRTFYSLRKYLRLAVQGNPSILILLYLGSEHILDFTSAGADLREMAPQIVSAQAGQRFLGYLDGQRQRLVGEGKQSRMPKRPELIEAYGWDVKYGYHALRLGLQGVELMRTGWLSLPMPEPERARCMAVRRGEVPLPDALVAIDETRETLRRFVDGEERTPLPPAPDLAAINDWSVWVHRRAWSAAV